jgi:hypothetical protein
MSDLSAGSSIPISFGSVKENDEVFTKTRSSVTRKKSLTPLSPKMFLPSSQTDAIPPSPTMLVIGDKTIEILQTQPISSTNTTLNPIFNGSFVKSQNDLFLVNNNSNNNNSSSTSIFRRFSLPNLIHGDNNNNNNSVSFYYCYLLLLLFYLFNYLLLLLLLLFFFNYM